MERVLSGTLICLLLACCPAVASDKQPQPMHSSDPFTNYVLGYETPVDPGLQREIEVIDSGLRAKYGMATNDTAVGVLDLQKLRLALVNPDRMEYAASLAKIGILLAYFQI